MQTRSQGGRETSNKQRREWILESLERQGYQSVADLAKGMGVSEMTIRRDLTDMESQTLLKRIHGGAVQESRSPNELDYKLRSEQNARAKRDVGLEAARMVQDGQVIYIDAGTTTLMMTEGLFHQRIMVVTPSIPVAQILAGRSNIEVLLLGGTVRPKLMAVTGHIAEQTLSAFRLDIAFLGAGGLDLERGLTQSAMEEIPLRKLAIQRAGMTVILVTREKIGRTGALYYTPVSDLDLVITEEDEGIVRYRRENGVLAKSL